MFGDNKQSSGSKKQRPNSIPFSTIILMIVSNGISFSAGTLLALNAGLGTCASSSSSTPIINIQGQRVDFKRGLKKKSVEAAEVGIDRDAAEADSNNNKPDESDSFFPPEVQRYAVGMVHTKKEDFTNHFDLGVPLDIPKAGDEDVLILYSKTSAMPSSSGGSFSAMELLETEKAIENCDYLNVILTHHDGSRKQCVAIVPQVNFYYLISYRVRLLACSF